MNRIKQIAERDAFRAAAENHRWVVEYKVSGSSFFDGHWTRLGARWSAYAYETFSLSPCAAGAIVHGPFSSKEL